MFSFFATFYNQIKMNAIFSLNIRDNVRKPLIFLCVESTVKLFCSQSDRQAGSFKAASLKLPSSFYSPFSLIPSVFIYIFSLCHFSPFSLHITSILTFFVYYQHVTSRRRGVIILNVHACTTTRKRAQLIYLM